MCVCVCVCVCVRGEGVLFAMYVCYACCVSLADSENYPHMRTLLLFDTREFLNVLTLVSYPIAAGLCWGFP